MISANFRRVPRRLSCAACSVAFCFPQMTFSNALACSRAVSATGMPCCEYSQQGIPVALTAREHANAFENVICGKQKATEQAAQLSLRGTRRKFADII